MRKIYLAVFTVFLFITTGISAQDLEAGRNLYLNGDYESAALYFSRFDSPEALLFTGKSYYSMGKLLQAKRYLQKAAEVSEDSDILHETIYTLALADFQLKDFTAALEQAYSLKESSKRSIFQVRAEEMYQQVLNYLSLSQLQTVFKEANSDEIRFDLLESSIGRFNYEAVTTMFERFEQLEIKTNQNRLARIKEDLAYPEVYNRRYAVLRNVKAPVGIQYRIGVALPQFSFESDDYEISQHLYFGIQTAVEEFNTTHSGKKVFIKYRETGDEINNAEKAFNELIWSDDADAVIGPLFSDEAESFARLSDEYEIPVITPLATSSELGGKSNYLYQLNPTFTVHGKKMAQYAVNTLRLDTLAVIAEKNTPGAAAAYAFQDEAQKLGAVIKYFFIEDFKELGYSIVDFTAFFSKTDTADVAKGIKGIYAPFTGAAGTSMIQSLLTDLEATNSNYVLMGSEEWKSVNLSTSRFSNAQIYYSQSFNVGVTRSNERDSFDENFRQVFSTNPNQFAYIGYDAAQLILRALSEAENPDYLNNAIKNMREFSGLSTRISFLGDHVNQSVEIKRVDN